MRLSDSATTAVQPASPRAPQRTPKRARFVILAAVVIACGIAALVFVTRAGSGGNGGRQLLRVAGADDGSSAGAIIPDVSVGATYVHLAQDLCVVKHPVRITRITLVRPQGGMTVVDWAVRNHRPGDGYDAPLADGRPGRAHDLPGFGHQLVTTRCSAQGNRVTQFAVSVRLVSSAAASDAFEVHWRDGNTTGSVLVPYGLSECASEQCSLLSHNAPQHT